jgi:ABC-2 type transport system ATP-binding protein
MILGLDKPTSGAATIGGRRLAEIAQPMSVVGALLDARAVHPKRTARDHLAAIARAGNVPRQRVARLLEMVGLADSANRAAGDFSLGMKQRLGIATALIGDPGIVIFDEPLNGLDPEGIRWARSLMRNLAAEGRTVLFSSHLMGEMELTADHLIVVNHGGLLADQNLAEFIDGHTTERVHARTPDRAGLLDALLREGLPASNVGSDGLDIPDVSTDRIGHVAASNSIELSELTTKRDSLEDAFLRMTVAKKKNQD